MQKKLKFVSSNSGTSSKTGKAYSFCSLSNGVRTAVVGNPKSIDCSSFKEGDDVLVSFDIDFDYKNNLVLVLQKIEKIK